jgi:hypothetical protein
MWLKLLLLPPFVARVAVVPNDEVRSLLEHVVDRVETILVNVVEMDSWHHPFRVVTSLTTWDDDVVIVVVVDRIDNAMAMPDGVVVADDEDDRVQDDDRVRLDDDDDDDSHFVGVWAFVPVMSRLQDWLLLL